LNIIPHIVKLHFRAHVAGSVGAKVELANRKPDQYWKALVAISNRERSIAWSCSGGRMTADTLTSRVQRLVDHRNALACPGAKPFTFEQQLRAIRNWNPYAPVLVRHGELPVTGE
jgi:hypothetical protein